VLLSPRPRVVRVQRGSICGSNKRYGSSLLLHPQDSRIVRVTEGLSGRQAEELKLLTLLWGDRNRGVYLALTIT
jgi:hypothetical protein